MKTTTFTGVSHTQYESPSTRIYEVKSSSIFMASNTSTTNSATISALEEEQGWSNIWE